MDVINFAAKLPLVAVPGLDQLIGVFHTWIRTGAITDDVLVDVADYAHVHEGPMLLLVCHEGHYVIDRSRGQLGLAYLRRRGASAGSAAANAERTLRRLVHVARLLERDAPGAVVGTDSLEIRVLDRLHASNTDDTWRWLEPTIATAIESVWKAAPRAIVRDLDDARRTIGARIELAPRKLAELG